MRTRHTIVIGDARHMKEVPDESVHLVVTSPPYWQIKDYGSEYQIGFDHTYQQYINNLNLVWKEGDRVLHPGCRLCINIGDQFARAVDYGRYKIIPIREEIIKFCEVIGFDYMGAIIWQKATTCNTTGGATVMGSYPYPRNGVVKLDYEFILLFRKRGEPPKSTPEAKEASRLTREEWNQYFYGHWNFPGERQDRHQAVFPEELPRRLIKMFSFPGETVLDPFLGSGTTSLAAKNLDRNSIGYEISPASLPVIQQKLGMDGLLTDADFTVLRQEKTHFDPSREIAKLPYIFADPVGMQRQKKGRKETGTGSDARAPDPAELLTVKKVISPELVLLSNGATVRLLGIRAAASTLHEAVELIKDLTTKQKVFLRFDGAHHDEEGHPLCYLYLKNRTFVNARLVKRRLVDVDIERDYRHKARFLSYALGR